MSAAGHVASAPPKPLVIFDGDCGFCRYWIRRWQRATGDTVDYIALQDDRVARQFPEISRAALEKAVHLIEPDANVYRGAEAVFRSQSGVRCWPLALYEKVPGARAFTERVYALVAANRTIFSTLTRLLFGLDVQPSTYLLVRRLFLRALGVVYLIAFISLGLQIIGLSGEHGIVPAKHVLSIYAQQSSGWARYYNAPTLCWFAADDAFVQSQCVAGAVIALLLIAGLAPLPCLIALWVLYLSLSVVCPVFLGFQWDGLLLESGLLAMIFAPARLWPNLARERPPSAIGLWLLRVLLFKLMFASGVVKLASHDVTWRQLTALTVHYETQPLPTWTAWYMHQLPEWVHKTFCAGMFGIELIAPFLIFLPRRPRFLAFTLFVILQFVIALTGNYTFFNLLAVVLCIPLLDDEMLARVMARSWKSVKELTALRPRPRFSSLAWTMRIAPRCVIGLIAAVVLAVSAVEVFGPLGIQWRYNSPLVRLRSLAAPLRSINGYGLFAVMTTNRPEIIVEGSADGVNWLPYDFKYKPGDLMQRPRFVAPHQPRLDWQMWFAALGDVRQNPWFINFCVRLLEGKKEVLGLLKSNPFPGAPPKYMRASLYEYRFTNSKQRRSTGAWWRREYLGEYMPAISLKGADSPGTR